MKKIIVSLMLVVALVAPQAKPASQTTAIASGAGAAIAGVGLGYLAFKLIKNAQQENQVDENGNQIVADYTVADYTTGDYVLMASLMVAGAAVLGIPTYFLLKPDVTLEERTFAKLGKMVGECLDDADLLGDAKNPQEVRGVSEKFEYLVPEFKEAVADLKLETDAYLKDPANAQKLRFALYAALNEKIVDLEKNPIYKQKDTKKLIAELSDVMLAQVPGQIQEGIRTFMGQKRSGVSSETRGNTMPDMREKSKFPFDPEESSQVPKSMFEGMWSGVNTQPKASFEEEDVDDEF